MWSQQLLYDIVMLCEKNVPLRRSTRSSTRIETGISVTAEALDPAVDKLKLVKILALHRFEPLLAPRARQVVLRGLYRRRRGVPVQQAQHVAPSHESDVFRAYPESKQARREGAQDMTVAVPPKPGGGGVVLMVMGNVRTARGLRLRVSLGSDVDTGFSQ